MAFSPLSWAASKNLKQSISKLIETVNREPVGVADWLSTYWIFRQASDHYEPKVKEGPFPGRDLNQFSNEGRLRLVGYFMRLILSHDLQLRVLMRFNESEKEQIAECFQQETVKSILKAHKYRQEILEFFLLPSSPGITKHREVRRALGKQFADCIRENPSWMAEKLRRYWKQGLVI